MTHRDALVTAAELEQRGILKRGTAYRMARQGLIPARYVGVKKRGIRFCAEEVLETLKESSRNSPGSIET